MATLLRTKGSSERCRVSASRAIPYVISHFAMFNMCCGWELMTEHIKAHSQTYQNLATSAGIVKLGLALMEKLTTLLFAEGRDPGCYSALCVVHFRTRTVPAARKELLVQTFQLKPCRALEELVTLTQFCYPGILEKAYIINPWWIPRISWYPWVTFEEYCTVAESTRPGWLSGLSNTEYSSTAKPLTESDFLPNSNFHITSKESLDSKTQSDSAVVSTIIKTTEAEDIPTSPRNPEPVDQESCLTYSESISPQSIILDSDDLQTAVNHCLSEMRACLAFADSDMIVKYDHGVCLAEAKALHLISTCMTIAAPKPLSAYILWHWIHHDVIWAGWISGVLLEPRLRGQAKLHSRTTVWLHEPNADYYRKFYWGSWWIALSRWLHGIFEASYKDYTRYSYDSYPSEETFNEGIVQVLQDQLSPKPSLMKATLNSTFSTVYLTSDCAGAQRSQLCLRMGICIQKISSSRMMVWLFFWTGA